MRGWRGHGKGRERRGGPALLHHETRGLDIQCEFDTAQPPGFARTVTPVRRANAPPGDWNHMEITLRGADVDITLNGRAIIHTTLPALPARGPIGFQHEHGRVQFRNVSIKEIPAP